MESEIEIPQSEDLETEIEIDEAPFVEFDISVSPSDPSLELLVNQLERGDVIIPFYQRNFVWKIEQASKLIESFLMGLPVPQIFLYVNDQDQLEVIDGQQRLMSIKYFMEGFYGDEDARGRRQTFKLKGLSERSEYNGKLFAELSPRDQRKFRNSTLRAINIKQLKPSQRNDSVFHIFERLNTGGTRLKPQEIRNAVYRGPVVERLKALNSLAEWQLRLGMRQVDKSQKDVELVLRLFSLFRDWQNYEKPMLGYLNNSMNENRQFDSVKAGDFEVEFPLAVIKVVDAVRSPFRPRGVINSAVLESVIVVLMECPEITREELADRYVNLLSDSNFKSMIRGSTTDTAVLRSRIETAKRILSNVPV
jgi:hypothetical protein